MRHLLATFALCLLTSSSVFAQATAGFGGLSGVVKDATGASVPGASVVVANEARGIRRALETNSDGVFTVPALVPSAGYNVTVNKSGFNQFQTRDLQIAVGQNVNLDITLNVASTGTQVDVTAAAPLVEDTKTDVSQVVDTKQIVDLPINGRRVDSFVLLTPATVPDGTFGLISFRGIAGGNSFLTDGNDTTNGFYNENAGRTRISSQISQDAVQEFQVISNNFAAEYGRASGGVINTVTRSGTNAIHGTAYEFFRNRTLNARDRYANYNPPEWRHQAGGSLGGKIIKDKLFYFGNVEITRRNFPLIASVRGGNLFDANGNFLTTQSGRPYCDLATYGAGGTTPIGLTQAQCDAARNYLVTRNFGTVGRTADSNLYFLKLDYRPNDRNAISVSGNYMDWMSPNGIQTQAVLTNGNGIGNNANSTVRTRYGRAVWTFIPSSTIVNEARFGYFKDRLFDDASAEFLTPELGRAGLTVNGQSNLGYATSYPRLNPSEQRLQYADNLSWTKGRHAMKFGVDFTSTEDYQNQLSNQYGTYTYATFSQFAADFTGNTAGRKDYQSYSQRFGNGIVDTTIKDIGIYVQDQFRATSKLTVNYGVRYEYAWLPQPTLVNPDYPTQTGRIPSPSKNFAPRVGAAYSINDKTVVRAGYGIFYARFQGGLVNTLFLNNNVYQRSLTLQSTSAADLAIGPVFPNNIASLDRTPPAGTTGISFAAPDFRNPYTHQANIAIERQLGRDLGLTVSYLWSRGVHLYTVRDLNAGTPSTSVTYRINDASGTQVGSYTTPVYRTVDRIDSRYNRINQVENGGLSYYDGLAVQLNKRFSHSFQGSVAYTWAHAIDFNQGAGNDNIFFSGGPTSYINGNYAIEKGSSALDVRHRAVINTIWQPAYWKSDSAFAKYVVNNWQISQITTLQSAPPVTPTLSVSGAAFTGASFTGSLNGLGGSTRVPFLPLNSLNLDQIYRVDARVTKILPFTERVNLQLQFEAFNVTNTPYDTGRLSQLYSVAAGSLTLNPLASYGLGSASQAFPDGTNARRAQVSARFVF